MHPFSVQLLIHRLEFLRFHWPEIHRNLQPVGILLLVTGFQVKESYFTPETIESKALEMRQQVTNTRRRRSSQFTPERSALLLLDMQFYFIDEGSHAFVPSSRGIIPGLQELARAYASKGLPIIFTRHLNTPQDAAMMAQWWSEVITPGNPSSQIVPDFDQTMGIVIVKTQYDAFYKTDLESILRGKGVAQVVICGLMTHLCCETTARSAFVRGFEVFFPIDGTATYNETYHMASLLNLGHGFATPVLLREILSAVREANGS
jgi:bifunctional isochorismate lyase/aryl carrier protein